MARRWPSPLRSSSRLPAVGQSLCSNPPFHQDSSVRDKRTVSLQGSCVEAPTPSVTVCGDVSSRRVIRVQWGLRGGALSQQDEHPDDKEHQRAHFLCVCVSLRTQACTHTEESRVSTRRGDSHQQTRKTASRESSWARTFLLGPQLRNWEKGTSAV